MYVFLVIDSASAICACVSPCFLRHACSACANGLRSESFIGRAATALVFRATRGLLPRNERDPPTVGV
jgi:hypothetical protein